MGPDLGKQILLDISKGLNFIHNVRPILDPTGVAAHLLLELGGKPIANFSNATRVLTKRYGRKVPTPTSVRKDGATAAVKSLTHGQLTVVARQMGHSLSTSSQYYQAVVGADQATKAFQLRRSLMPAQDESSSEEEQTVLHNDLKLDNVAIGTSVSMQVRPYIIDFGKACSVGCGKTHKLDSARLATWYNNNHYGSPML